MKKAEVKFENITKKFNEVVAVDNVSCDFEAGTLTTLLGPSGCGKTTSLRIIAGLERATEGKILIDGEDVTLHPATDRDVSMVFQSYALFPHMSVIENVSYGLKMINVKKDEYIEKSMETLKLVNLEGYENRMPSELSGGQQQRVALARALIVQPKVLLLDEPLSNLDAHLRFEMRDLIRNLQQSMGITTIFVTHDQEEAVVLADKVALILDGKLKQYDKPDVFYKRPIDEATARFFGGQNFINGISKNGLFESSVGKFKIPEICMKGEGILTFRPENIQISDSKSTLNSVKAKIIEKIFLGTQTRLKLLINSEVIQVIANPNEVENTETGVEIFINFPPSSLWVMPK